MSAYRNMVYSTAVRLTASPAQAEDVAQDVFLKAWQHYAGLADNPAAGGWLRTVATRLSLNYLGRYRRRMKLASDLSTDDPDGDGTAPHEVLDRFVDTASQDSVLDAVTDAERSRLVEEAIARLPDHQRVPLVLYHFECLTYEAIAGHLGISLAKVKTDLHRARLALARSVGEHGGYAS